MTTLHLRTAEFKFTHKFIICNRLPDTELIFGIDIQKSAPFLMLGTKKRIVLFKRKENSYIHKKLWTEGNNWDS